MEYEMDLREYFFLIKKNILVIFLSAFICGIISGLISFFVIKPVYEVSTTLIVNKEDNDPKNQINTSEDIDLAQKLALTYGEIIKSRSVITSTINKLKLDLTYEKVSENITVTNVSDTQIIKITVKNNNPRLAVKICNIIPKMFDKEAQRVVKVSDIEIIDKAVLPKKPTKPNKTMNIVIAMIFGVIGSIFVIFLLEFLNTKIKTPKDIEDELGIPVLGVVHKY